MRIFNKPLKELRNKKQEAENKKIEIKNSGLPTDIIDSDIKNIEKNIDFFNTFMTKIHRSHLYYLIYT